MTIYERLLKGYRREQLEAMLPQVGDRLIRKPTLAQGVGLPPAKPQPCTVIYVHRENLWYCVEFASGIRRCFKLPDLDKDKEGSESE